MSKKDKMGGKGKGKAKSLGLEAALYAPLPYLGSGRVVSYGSNAFSSDKSLCLSAVWACVRFLSETVSTLPLKVYRKQPDGSREEATGHALHDVLCKDPNKMQTPMKMIQFMVACMALSGNCWFEKRFVGNRLKVLWPIEPKYQRRVEVKRDGSYVFHYTDENGVDYVKSENEIWLITGFNGLQTLLGIDPIAKGHKVFDSALHSQDAALNFLQQGLHASGFVTTDKTLNDQQREILKKYLQEFSGSKNSGKIMPLEAGMKFDGISINPEAAQLLETRGFDAAEICRFFRIPPPIIGYTDKASSWGSSLESMLQQVLTFTLLPILVNIEQSISKALIAPNERDSIYAEFNVEGFLRADSQARAAFYNTMLNNGSMNRNEVRKKENLPPMPNGGDVYTVQSALIPIEKVGENYDTARNIGTASQE